MVKILIVFIDKKDKGMKRALFGASLLLSLLYGVENEDLKQALEGGFIATTGNSKSSTVNAEYRLRYEYGKNTEMKFSTDMLYGKKKGKTSNERYRANFDLKRYYGDDLFYYFELYYLKNRFEGYKHQINTGFGLGYKIINKNQETLLGLGGLLMRYNSYTGEKKSELLSFVKLSADYKYKIDRKNSFVSKWYFMSNVEDLSDYESGLKSKLVFKLNSRLAFNVGFEVKYDNTPPEKNIYKTDTTTKIGISYDF